MKTYALAAACVALVALVGVTLASAQAGTPVAIEQPPASDFSTNITNPLFPLSLVGSKALTGEETDPDTGETYEKRLESHMRKETAVYDGVTVATWEERAFEDGQLVEVALDYFAQDSAGNVWYFGEHVDNYEDGVVVNNDGQWFAGEGDNKAGVLMPANPKVGETYQQERAPGVAEDMIDIVSVTDTVTTPAGTYSNCLKTRDYTPLEPGLEEFKWHCPGVGLARETGPGFEILLESSGGSAAPTASADSATTTAPVPLPTNAGVTPPSTGDGSSSKSGTASAWMVAGIAVLVAAGIAALAVLIRARSRS